jgi:two-component system chemotaxis sensor kinase CheA
VRDLASGAGKAARLELRCDDVEVDMAVADALRGPFSHLLRNAIDHGIEAPAERTRAGKPMAGLLTLSARREGGTLVVELADDGAGLDRERLLERGKKLGLPTSGLSDAEILELAFAPGLSTAERITDLSGRGIGMDVVRRTIEGMRGSVVLTSVAGQGATVTLRVPLALSIIQGLAVGVGGETCVLPLDHVVECVELDDERVVQSPQGGVLELRGEALPFVDLGCRLGLARENAPRPSVVVVQQDGKRAGLAVTALYGEVQTVIKPLGRLFETVKGIAGSAVLGDGRIALVVDVRGLMRAAV